MNQFEERLRELGITLPSLPAPIANYVPAKRVGNLIFTAGQVSVEDGREYKGKLGDRLSLDEARAATKACAINCLAAIRVLPLLAGDNSRRSRRITDYRCWPLAIDRVS